MARSRNANKPQRMVISVTPQICELLREIAKSGYGAKTAPSVAEEMIRKGLDASGLITDLLRRKLTNKAAK